MLPLHAVFLFLATAALAAAGPSRAAPVRTAHLTASLVAETASLAPGSTVYAAVVLTADKGWHTYWRNPGDAGEPTTVHWTLPAGWRAGEIVWPPPVRLPLGPLMNYGYVGQTVLASPIEIPAGARPGDTAAITASVDFLVCAEVCVPGAAVLHLTLPVADGPPRPDPHWGPIIQSTLAAAPKPGGLEATFRRQGAEVKVAVAGAALVGAKGSVAYFYPFDDRLIDQAKPQTIDRGPRGLTIAMAPGGDFAGGREPRSAQGVLEVDGKAFEVDAAPGPPPSGASGLGPPAPPAAPMGAALALLFAFAGGLILNLMPCVFPILSMKAAALARHGADLAAARRNGLAFAAGVLASFLGLADVLIAARAGGQAIGWGFQLQSPVVVAALALVIFAAALNLSGLFEVGASLQGLGSGLTRGDGVVGSLLTGVLAVTVAAPCTAPLMGAALGYALTQPAFVALEVFLALGLGFAAPFALISFSPALLRHLPAPGPWMDGAKKILAFPLYASTAWLAWVLARQSGSDGLARLLAALIVMGAGASLLGAAERRRARGGAASPLLVLAGVAGAICIGLISGARSETSAPAGSLTAEIPSEPFTPARLAELRSQGRPVLVNFTADWCVTCQVNERLALFSPAVAQALARVHGAYLVADWTRRDAVIAKTLADHGRIGVPLYLVYDVVGDEATALPQILTPSIVADALGRAAVRPAAAAAR